MPCGPLAGRGHGAASHLAAVHVGQLRLTARALLSANVCLGIAGLYLQLWLRENSTFCEV